MKLYGADVSEGYIQYKDGKKKHIRYPRAKEYPREAREQERMGIIKKGGAENGKTL